jgi:hypothetical protein
MMRRPDHSLGSILLFILIIPVAVCTVFGQDDQGDGTVVLRGTVHNLGENVVMWTNTSFAGFYYDIDKNLGAAELIFRLSNASPTR